MITTSGDRSIEPVSGMILRTGRRMGSRMAFTARHMAATKSLLMFTTLNEISRLITNCTITTMTMMLIR